MGKIIHTTNSSRERLYVFRMIISAIQMLKASPGIDNEDRKDAVAFIVLSLMNIRDSINQTANAWEKRNYWLKADKFRLQWSWVEKSIVKIMEVIHLHTIENINPILLEITKKIGDVHPTRKMPGRTIWEGSWDKLLSISQEKLH